MKKTNPKPFLFYNIKFYHDKSKNLVSINSTTNINKKLSSIKREYWGRYQDRKSWYISLRNYYDVPPDIDLVQESPELAEEEYLISKIDYALIIYIYYRYNKYSINKNKFIYKIFCMYHEKIIQYLEHIEDKDEIIYILKFIISNNLKT